MKLQLFLFLAAGLVLATTPAVGQNKPAILVVSGGSLNQLIDPDYKQKMESEGYRLDSSLVESLTWERISQFNVLVLERIPSSGQETRHALYVSALPTLKRFLDEGGGILWLYDNEGNSNQAVNAFTKDYGLEMLNESIWDNDESHKFKQSQYRRQVFITTAQIAEHPTTHGLKRIAVPDAWYNAYAFVAGPEWKVLISAESTAYSENPFTKVSKTYDTEPPIFAVRDLPTGGRMAVFSVMSTWTVQAGYHRIWEGLVLDRGGAYALLRNTYDWLAQPSLESASVGGFTGEGSATTTKQECLYNPYPMELQVAPKRHYSGLIGAHSDIVGAGEDSVADMCRAARREGLNFLVFTEPFAQLNDLIWDQLSTECARQTWGDFVAIPGFEYTQRNGIRRIYFNIRGWLSEDLLDEQGYFRYLPDPFFRLDYPTTVYVDTHHPDRPAGAYHTLKFYNALALFTYDPMGLVDDSVDRYKILTQDRYWLRPIAVHDTYSVADLTVAASSNNYRTHVLAPSIREVPQAMQKQRDPSCYFGNSCYVANGPTIHDFRMIGEGWTIDPWETYYLWESGDKATLRIDVSSERPLTDVVVYRVGEKYWHFRPSSRRFKIELPYVFESGGHLRMEVIDDAGRRAYSSPLSVRHSWWWATMCADLQNTIHCGIMPADSGGIIFRNAHRRIYAGIGNLTTGVSGAMMNPIASMSEIVPDGLDAIYGGFSLGRGVRISVDGKVVDPRQTRHSFVHATGSVSIMESHGDTLVDASLGSSAPKDFVTLTRTISCPCRMDGYNVIEVQHTVRFLRDVTVSDNPNALPITLIRMVGKKSQYPNVSYDSGGRTVRVERDKLTEPVVAKLDKFGGVCLYPQFWGSGAIFAVDGKRYDVRAADNGITVGLNEPGRKFKKGDVLTARFIAIRDSGRDPDDRGMRALMANHGVGSEPAYGLAASGQVISDYSPIVVTQGKSTDIKVSQAELANDLIVRVKGLQPNWSAGCYDRAAKKLERVGVFQDTSYVAVDTREARDLFAGNLLTCMSSDVRLTLVESTASSAKFLAHNLSDKPVTTVVESAGAKAGLPEFRRSVSLGPGELKTIDVE